MSRIQFVSRSDDLGSSLASNQAIDAVTRAGFIRNVSVMAPGTAVESAAGLLAPRKDICFGMHTTLNAEWDRVKWGPVLPLSQQSGLVDKNGFFLSDPRMFEKTKPDLEIIMREVNAQLEKLHSLGFDIRYIDSHMMPEMIVEGMDEAMEAFIQKKGLIDHMYFYNLPPGFHDLRAGLPDIMDFLKSLPDGQYFFVTHPALDTEETRKTGNAQCSGEDIARGRAYEAEVFSNPEICKALLDIGCAGVRYDEAVPGKRLTIEDVKAIFMVK